MPRGRSTALRTAATAARALGLHIGGRGPTRNSGAGRALAPQGSARDRALRPPRRGQGGPASRTAGSEGAAAPISSARKPALASCPRAQLAASPPSVCTARAARGPPSRSLCDDENAPPRRGSGGSAVHPHRTRASSTGKSWPSHQGGPTSPRRFNEHESPLRASGFDTEGPLAARSQVRADAVEPQ